MKLYTYWRSSAAYRVRIALNLKEIECDMVPVHLAEGQQHEVSYKGQNPQGLLPALEHNGQLLVQSMAIIEYLDTIRPEPRLLPQDPLRRARVAGMAQAVACEVHPLNNLRVQNYLKNELNQDNDAVQAWFSHWIHVTFGPLEQWASQYSAQQRFMFGDSVSLADLCLVPQIYNARRFKVNLDNYPTLIAIDRHLCSLPAFLAASPEQQADAVI